MPAHIQQRADCQGQSGLTTTKQYVNTSLYHNQERRKKVVVKMSDIFKKPSKRRSISSAGTNASIYASTILSLEAEDQEAEEEPLNDQQWVLQRKKIGLSRRTKRSLEKVNQNASKRNHIASFLKSFKRKECVRFVEDPASKGRPLAAGPGPSHEKACFCGAPTDEHRSRVQLKLEENRHLIGETIVEEDETTSSTNASRASSTTVLIEKLTGNKDQKVAPVLTVEDTAYKEFIKKDERLESKMETPESDAWCDENDIHEFPTNAFGLIEFLHNEEQSSVKPSKYVRISDNTPMSKIHTLLVDYWGILRPHRPHLALSLIGGAKNFKMEGRKKEVFKNGLISAAKSTNALILTAGNNIGTMKLVGDAVGQGQFLVKEGNSFSRGLRLIGLTSWGYVKNNKDLLNLDPNELHNASYNSNVEILPRDNVPLNHDHTHFIFIDDGSRYRFFGKYSEFITKFESMVREAAPKGLGIPIVTLLLEGGIDAIRIIKQRLNSGIAAVVIEGSGRAADIIAYAYKNATKNSSTGTYSLKEGHVNHLEKMIGSAYHANKTNREQLKSVLNWTLECIRYSDIITIFDIRRETQLDKKILSALLKLQDMTLHQQLYLAMIWDRVDLAEEKIFVHGAETLECLKKNDSLDDIMLQALLLQRTAFIELLVMNGFVMKNFLTVEKLAKLYNEATKKFKELNIQLKQICGINSSVILLRHIHKFLQVIVKDHSHPIYKYHTYKASDNESFMSKTFEEPYMELYLWAVFTGKMELVEFFWLKVREPLVSAVIAAAIYSKLADFYKKSRNLDSNDKVTYEKNVEFQERANEIVEIAMVADVNKGMSILNRRHERWGDHNLMELSYVGQLRAFIANRGCQAVVQQAWRRGFVRLDMITCIFGIFLPFLVWTPLVKFQPGLGDNGGSLNPFQKVYVFYKCPFVKYCGICISYFCFITLFSYVALFGYRWHYQIPEIGLYAWILILITGEVRELLKEPSHTLKGKWNSYISNMWNKIDVFFVCMAFLAFFLRHFWYTFWYSRIVFAFNCGVYYLRIFRTYHASQRLGPKLVIFQKMVPQIASFLMLLIVFILAYGVAVQALIDPYRPFTWTDLEHLVQDIIFLPYWQMYGELQLDAIAVKDSTGCYDNVTCAAPDWKHIGDATTVTPLFLALYLLIGNVLLLNLLIAIFTSIYEEINSNSNDVWKWEMYRLCEEYDNRPGLAPPLVIVEDTWRLMKTIWKHTCRKKRENLDLYMEETVDVLKLFEKDCMETYRSRHVILENSGIEPRLANLEKKTDTLLEMFEDAPDDSANWGEDITTDHKFYNTSSSSSDDENESKLKIPGREQMKPGASRVQTAKAIRGNHLIQQDISKLKIELERLESKRENDVDKLEKQIQSGHQKLEALILTLLKNQNKS